MIRLPGLAGTVLACCLSLAVSPLAGAAPDYPPTCRPVATTDAARRAARAINAFAAAAVRSDGGPSLRAFSPVPAWLSYALILNEPGPPPNGTADPVAVPRAYQVQDVRALRASLGIGSTPLAAYNAANEALIAALRGSGLAVEDAVWYDPAVVRVPVPVRERLASAYCTEWTAETIAGRAPDALDASMNAWSARVTAGRLDRVLADSVSRRRWAGSGTNVLNALVAMHLAARWNEALPFGARWLDDGHGLRGMLARATASGSSETVLLFYGSAARVKALASELSPDRLDALEKGFVATNGILRVTGFSLRSAFSYGELPQGWFGTLNAGGMLEETEIRLTPSDLTIDAVTQLHGLSDPGPIIDGGVPRVARPALGVSDLYAPLLLVVRDDRTGLWLYVASTA
ncbi:MAG TPA: hypothetical protein VGD01_11240 [Candidatus Elarobacter sp.]